MSGFKSMVAGLVQSAFGIVGDMADAVTYTSVSASAYDPVAGSATDTSTVYNFNGAVTRFGLNEVDSKIVVTTDAKLLCSGLDLPVQPNENDTVVVTSVSADGNTTTVMTYKVMRTLGVPGQGFWKIHIREV